jgi:hypothetical protein
VLGCKTNVLKVEGFIKPILKVERVPGLFLELFTYMTLEKIHLTCIALFL